ncbi:MAG: DNA-binding protein WhiA, partial [Pygmaiobacter sp.]
MSFAYELKSEICNNRPFRQRFKKALTYGLLLFGKSFDESAVSLHTEHRAVARLYADGITDLVRISGSITVREVRRAQRRSVFAATVDDRSDRLAILAFFSSVIGADHDHIRREQLSEEEIPVFLSGVFLACAGISNPEKSYRVEFSTPSKTLADDLETLLSEYVAPPKRTVRRNDYIVYYKESENVEDLLTFIGAPKSSLELMEVKIVKDLRNRVNRATNCETANIGKTVDAAITQIADIHLIETSCG